MWIFIVIAAFFALVATCYLVYRDNMEKKRSQEIRKAQEMQLEYERRRSAYITSILDKENDRQDRLRDDFLKNGISPAAFFEFKKRQAGDVVGVYILYNQNRNMYYVGQAKRVYYRLMQHFSGHGNPRVWFDYQQGHQFKIKMKRLSDSGYDDLDKLERDTIAEYHAYDIGYNETRGNGQ